MGSKIPAVCVDLDGTLVDVGSIRHLVLNKRKDYDGFAYMSLFCPPIEWVANSIRALHADGHYKIIIVSARSDKWVDLTLEWLFKNNIPFDGLRMRNEGDIRKDREVKEDIVDELEEHFRITMAWDDNPNILAMWNERGIPAIEVPGWNDESEEAVESQA